MAATKLSPQRTCLACTKNYHTEIEGHDDFKDPALCGGCLDRAGENIKVGTRVVCEVDGAIFTVKAFDGGAAQVKESDINWYPTAQLIEVK